MENVLILVFFFLQYLLKNYSQYSQLFRQACIFGSAARGEEGEHSNVDLIIVRNTALSFIDRGKEVIELIRALGGADCLIYTEDEFEHMKSEKSFIQKYYRRH